MTLLTGGRRILGLIVVGAAVLLVRAPVHADDLVLDRFGDYLEALRVQIGIPGLAATIVGSSDISWERGFGNQDNEHAIAARTDTPFAIDGMTQVLMASLVLRCAEDGRLTLDDQVGTFVPTSPEPTATLRQLLSHTSSDGTFRYRLDRLDPLAAVITQCTRRSFLQQVGDALNTLGMLNSVPGADIVQLAPTPGGFFDSTLLGRYRQVLLNLATPYAVDASGRASVSRYAVTTLTPGGGLISSARDLAQLIIGLRKGVIIRPDTLAQSWRTPIGPDGQRLPHGLGWFVQSYNGETIAWQFGVAENASSSLMIVVPGRGVAFVLVANSDGLSRSIPLAAGDLTTSPFGRLFLGLYVR